MRKKSGLFARMLLHSTPLIEVSKPLDADYLAQFTSRQLQIMVGVAEGGMVDDISTELLLAPGTVKSHQKLIATKMGIDNNRELFALAVGMAGSSEASRHKEISDPA